MKRLWAPWRLKYIREEKEDECFLCRILAGDADRENLLLKRGPTCAILMNRYPYSNGHLMVCPNRHVADIDSLSSEERLETMDLVAAAVRALRETVQPEGFNVGINLGQAAGAGLEEHLHTHIVPRWTGDTNFMPVIGDARVIPQALQELWDRLLPVLNDAL